MRTNINLIGSCPGSFFFLCTFFFWFIKNFILIFKGKCYRMVNRWRKVVDLGLKCHKVDNVNNFVDNFQIHLF